MPKKSFEEIGRDHQERLEKRRTLWLLFQRHPDFIHFCKTRFPKLRRNKIRIELDAWLPPALSVNVLDIIGLPPPLRISPEEHILMSFLETREGEALARRLGLWPFEPAVQVIPHQRARDIKDRSLRPRNVQERLALYLRSGRFLHLRIDCSESLTHLRAEIALQIRRYRPLVAANTEPDRPRFKPYLKGKWLHIELDLIDLHMEWLKRTLAEFKKQVEPKPKRRGISLDKEDIEIYDRVQSGESYHAIGREEPEVIYNHDFQEAARKRAQRSVRKIKKIHKTKTPIR